MANRELGAIQLDTCPECNTPGAKLVTDSRSADRYICQNPDCGLVYLADADFYRFLGNMRKRRSSR